MPRNLILLVVTQILCLACTLPAPSNEPSNELALGKAAKVKGSVDIPLIQPIDLNFKLVSDVMLLRRRAVEKHANFLASKYIPNKAVYGEMVDRRPWWGLHGLAYYGSGQKSIEGPSVQSLLLLNPYVLVGDIGVRKLPDNLTEDDLKRNSYPLYFEPVGLRLTPEKNIGEVSYDVSGFQRRRCQIFNYSEYKIEGSTQQLELINARDLGFNYYFIPPTHARNIQLPSTMNSPMSIPDYIHCGGSCGYPGGCNNRSPTNEYVKAQITKIPAQVSVMFWKDPPKTGRELPDMTFTVHYR